MVTIISTLPPIKGVSPYTKELCKSLSKWTKIDFIGFKSIYPEFIYPGGTKDKGVSPPKIKNLENRSFLTWYNPLTWIWAGLSAKGKILHAQWWSHVLFPIYFTIFLIAKLRLKKIILTVHNVSPHEKSWISSILNKIIFCFGNHYIVHSNNVKKTFCRRFNIPSRKTSVIPHGIINPPIKGCTNKEARNYIGISQHENVVLFFGNIREYKGLDVLIKAFNTLNIKHKKLIIAGKCWEDKKKYTKLIKNDVIFVNEFIPSDKIEYYFKASDLVVLPYKQFEAASGVGGLVLPFHKPFIVSDVGGLPDLVKSKEAVFEPGNINELSVKMKKILEDKNLSRRLSEEARSKEREYGWDKIAERTYFIYKSFLNK